MDAAIPPSGHERAEPPTPDTAQQYRLSNTELARWVPVVGGLNPPTAPEYEGDDKAIVALRAGVWDNQLLPRNHIMEIVTNVMHDRHPRGLPEYAARYHPRGPDFGKIFASYSVPNIVVFHDRLDRGELPAAAAAGHVLPVSADEVVRAIREYNEIKCRETVAAVKAGHPDFCIANNHYYRPQASGVVRAFVQRPLPPMELLVPESSMSTEYICKILCRSHHPEYVAFLSAVWNLAIGCGLARPGDDLAALHAAGALPPVELTPLPHEGDSDADLVSALMLLFSIDRTPVTEYTYDIVATGVRLVCSAAGAISKGTCLNLPSSHGGGGGDDGPYPRTSVAICPTPGLMCDTMYPDRGCLMSNVAVAVSRLRERDRFYGRALPTTTAVLDLSYRHPSGTQAAFYSDMTVLTISIHAVEEAGDLGGPDYTGDGQGHGFNFNCLLQRPTPSDYLAAVDLMCARIDRYRPRYFVVVLGLDTFAPGSPFGFGQRECRLVSSRIRQQEFLTRTPTMILVETGGETKGGTYGPANAFFSEWAAGVAVQRREVQEIRKAINEDPTLLDHEADFQNMWRECIDESGSICGESDADGEPDDGLWGGNGTEPGGDPDGYEEPEAEGGGGMASGPAAAAEEE